MVVVVVEFQGVVAERQGVADHCTAGSQPAAFAVAIAADGVGENVVGAERVVDFQSRQYPYFPGGGDAGVVDPRGLAPAFRRRQGDDDVAFAAFFAGDDLHGDAVLGRDALELFEALLEVAEVEDVARADGKGGPPVAGDAVGGEAEGADAAGDEDAGDGPAAEVLRGDGDEGGYVAAVDEGGGEAFDDEGKALGADIAAGVGVEHGLGPGEARGAVAGEDEVFYREGGRFVGKRGVPGRLPAFLQEDVFLPVALTALLVFLAGPQVLIVVADRRDRGGEGGGAYADGDEDDREEPA